MKKMTRLTRIQGLKKTSEKLKSLTKAEFPSLYDKMKATPKKVVKRKKR